MQIFLGKISSTVHDFALMLIRVLSIGLGFGCRSFFNGDLIKRNKGVNVSARNLNSLFHVIVADGRILHPLDSEATIANLGWPLFY